MGGEVLILLALVASRATPSLTSPGSEISSKFALARENGQVVELRARPGPFPCGFGVGGAHQASKKRARTAQPGEWSAARHLRIPLVSRA
jgi:hypothetical protein